MILRTLVLLAIGMSTSINISAIEIEILKTSQLEILDVDPELPKISLAQFTYDILQLDGLQAALDTMRKYANSDKFYFDKNEIYNSGHILYSNGMKVESRTIFAAISQYFPQFEKSFTQQLFQKLISSNKENSDQWLEENRNNKQLYFDQTEFSIAIKTLMELKDFESAIILAKINLEEYPNDNDNHVLLAKVHNAAGEHNLALQHMQNSFLKLDYVSFPELAMKSRTIYIPTVLSRDTTNLFVHKGSIDNDTAYVFVQGGPMPDLSAYRVRPLELLSSEKELLKIDVLQSQMINQSILTASPALSEEQLLFEHNMNAEILHRTVSYLKSRGKTVFVIGHSYGCFIGIEYLHSKPNLADKLILMAADFDEDLRNFQNNPDGTRKFIRWQNGVTPYDTDFWSGFPLSSILRDKMEGIFANTEGLVSAPAKRKHTELLKGKDLSNVLFYHARFDEANGRTSQTELDFLQSHGATTIESYGNHHSMLSKDYMENIYDYLTTSAPLKKSLASTLVQDLNHKDWESAIQQFQSNETLSQFFPISEIELNTLGYNLIAKGKTTEALVIFRINAQRFPNSWNAYDSLAETYLALGNSIEGYSNYRKSLELNPANMFAIKALRQLSNLVGRI